MASRRGMGGDGSDNHDPKRLEPTQRVRMRRPNPLIERKPSARADSDTVVVTGDTVHAAPTVARVVPGLHGDVSLPEDETQVIGTREPPVQADVTSPELSRRRADSRLATDTVPLDTSPLRDGLLVSNSEIERPAALARGLFDNVEGEASRRLASVLAGEHDAPGIDASVSPKRALEHLIHEAAFSALSQRDRACVLEAIALFPEDVATMKAAIAILKTGVTGRISADRCARLVDVFSASSVHARVALARLATRKVGDHIALDDLDFEGRATLDHIHALATRGLLARELTDLDIESRQIASVVLVATAHPERLSFEEGEDGLYGVLEFALAATWPGEFARVVHDLVVRDMIARLASGYAIDLGKRLRRGASANLRKSSLLRIALGDLPLRRRANGAPNDLGFIDSSDGSLAIESMTLALERLFGAAYHAEQKTDEVLRRARHLDAAPTRLPPALCALSYERGVRLFVLDRVVGGDVQLLAPRGRSTKRPGASRMNPKRTVVDPDRGIDAMSLRDFRSHVRVAWFPARTPSTTDGKESAGPRR